MSYIDSLHMAGIVEVRIGFFLPKERRVLSPKKSVRTPAVHTVRYESIDSAAQYKSTEVVLRFCHLLPY